MFAGREWKTDLKARGDLLRPRHGDEKGMEIGAVAAFGITREEGVAAPPSGATLVVAHVVEDVFVDGVRLLHPRRPWINSLRGQLRRQSGHRHQLVGLLES